MALLISAAFGGLVVVLAVLALVANLLIIHDASRFIVSGVAPAPPAPVALVPAAGVNPDGTLTPMTADRVLTAIQLYREGKVKAIDLSGYPDQVPAMVSYAEAHGVGAGDLLSDPAGFDTYDTMKNARSVLYVEKALVCTQRFHLSRAVYLARSLGIDATGVPADMRPYPGSWFATSVREWGARLKAYLQVHL